MGLVICVDACERRGRTEGRACPGVIGGGQGDEAQLGDVVGHVIVRGVLGGGLDGLYGVHEVCLASTSLLGDTGAAGKVHGLGADMLGPAWIWRMRRHYNVLPRAKRQTRHTEGPMDLAFPTMKRRRRK